MGLSEQVRLRPCRDAAFVQLSCLGPFYFTEHLHGSDTATNRQASPTIFLQKYPEPLDKMQIRVNGNRMLDVSPISVMATPPRISEAAATLVAPINGIKQSQQVSEGIVQSLIGSLDLGIYDSEGQVTKSGDSQGSQLNLTA